MRSRRSISNWRTGQTAIEPSRPAADRDAGRDRDTARHGHRRAYDAKQPRLDFSARVDGVVRDVAAFRVVALSDLITQQFDGHPFAGRRGIEEAGDFIDQAADEFAECEVELNNLFYGALGVQIKRNSDAMQNIVAMACRWPSRTMTLLCSQSLWHQRHNPRSHQPPTRS